MDGFDYSVVTNQNGLPLQRSNPDDALIVIFSVRAVQKNSRTEAMGCPQFDEVEHVKIMVPGERGELYDGPVREKDRERFKAKYDAWKAKKQVAVEGMPIEQWPVLSVAQIAELKANNVFTVENICDIPDSRLRVLGLFGRKLRDQAKDFMAQARGQAPLLQLRSDNEKLQERITVLEEQNRQLMMHLQTAKSGGQVEVTAPVAVPNMAEMVQQAVAAALAGQNIEAPRKGGRPKKIKAGGEINE